jgi:hypothetical protein
MTQENTRRCSDTKSIGNGYTVIFTAQDGRNNGFVPVMVRKRLGREVKRTVMNHVLFNTDADAADFARHAYEARA